MIAGRKLPDYEEPWIPPEVPVFDPNWTYEQARAAQDTQERWRPPDRPEVNKQPLMIWYAEKRLEAREQAYRSGDKSALASAIQICATCERPLPQWVARAFARGYSTLATFQAKSWDEILGEPHPKGTQLAAKHARWRDSFGIYESVIKIIESDPNRSIDAGLFEEVGEKFGIGKTRAEEYYRYQLDAYGFPSALEIRKALIRPKE